MTALVPRRITLIACLAVAAILLAIASLLTGPTRFGSAEIAGILAGGGDPVLRAVLIELRLPRALIGLMVGAILGLGGAVLQGYLRNPLAEPSVLGTSNAAALGAVIALYFGIAQAHPLALPLLAIGGAMAGLVPLAILAGRAESPLSLILAGIEIGRAHV